MQKVEMMEQEVNAQPVNTQPRLSRVERATLFVILILLTTLATTSFAKRMQHISGLQERLQVRVVGEVREPVTLEVASGSTIADILARLVLTEKACPESMAQDAKVVHDQLIIIPRKNCVSVYVKGAVLYEGVHVFEEHATYLTLCEKGVLAPNADVRALKRKKRALYEGETVCVRFLK
jgi:hypothetical protein